MTYTIQKYPSKNSEQLFRPDGMLIAMVQDVSIRMGEDPAKASTRMFISPEAAKRYLREVFAVEDCSQFAGSSKPRFEEQDMENRIIAPDNRLVFQ